ncbi:MAG: hypothetical protein ACM3PT_12945 [Deltaproteobacteria bacterium]
MTRLQYFFQIIFVLFFCINGYAQDNIKCYISTGDFIQNKIYDAHLEPKIKAKNDQFFKISKFINIEDDEKDDLASMSWAILADGELYINLRYSYDYQNAELYVKPFITGKICTIIIDENTDQKILTGGTHYGAGLQGVLMKESQKWGKNWIDKLGNKHKLLIFNTTLIKSNHLNRNVNVIGELLTRKNFNVLLGLNLAEDDIEKLNFDDILNLIRNKNLN